MVASRKASRRGAAIEAGSNTSAPSYTPGFTPMQYGGSDSSGYDPEEEEEEDPSQMYSGAYSGYGSGGYGGYNG